MSGGRVMGVLMVPKLTTSGCYSTQSMNHRTLVTRRFMPEPSGALLAN